MTVESPGLLILFGTGLMLYALWNGISAFESRRWPQAPGVILASYAERSYDSEGGTQFTHVIRYRYRANKVELVGTRVSFSGMSWGNPERRITDEYRVGQEVVVFYNPENAEESVLEPGLNRSLVILFVFGWGLIAIGAFYL